jgi:hypothetical protein
MEAGRAHSIIDAKPIDRFFVAMMVGLQRHPTADSSGGVMAVNRHGPLRAAGAVTLAIHGDTLIYSPRTDSLRVFGDKGEGTVLLKASSLTVVSEAPEPRSGYDNVLYDPAADRGVLCGGDFTSLRGAAFLALAFDGARELAVRPLGPSSRYPFISKTATWGCDWDGAARVYEPLPALGQLAVLDLETGAIVQRHFVGLGMRATTLDRRRGRLYLADYLRGNVVAFTVEPFREVRRWFVGRFVRDLVLTRDGQGLLVTSNVGLTRLEVP